jgi:hypothetical protein
MADNHSYFVKHLGTSLSYHNIYAWYNNTYNR